MPYLEYDDHGTIRRVNLAGDRETFIGRDQQCTICLAGVPQVSRRHCVVYFNTNLNAYALADMHSTNGTKLNGVKISQNDVTLNDGDRIQVGAIRFTFRGEQEQPDVKLVDPLNIDPLSYAPVIPSVAPGMQKNSGTTLRLLTGLLTGYPGKFVLDGDASIRKRPMKRVVEPLREMGAKITFSEGVRAPLSVTGARLKGISYNMPVASAQVKSAILLAGLNADGITTVHETIRSRNHTELMLKAMGAKIWIENHATAIMRGTLTAIDVDVPGDISSAAYPMVLAACLKGAHVTLKNVGVNPTRTGIITVMKECGAAVEESQVRYAVEKIATLDVSYTGNMKPFNIGRELIPYLIDEIPVLAVLACFIDGESVITGAEELKVKESNRIDTTVGMLKAMGADITATDDGMIIRGGKGLKGGATIDPRGDHRIAMAAAVAAAMSERGADILDPGCVAVSYPDFFRILEE